MKQVDQASVNYRAGTPEQSCASCVNFMPPESCAAVSGVISPKALCDLYSMKAAPPGLENEVFGGPLDGEQIG